MRGDHDLQIIKISENLDVVPSTLDLASIEFELASKFARELVLKKLVDELHGMDKLTDIISMVRENLNPSLTLGGVFITQYIHH